jgi:hypothetical protein
VSFDGVSRNDTEPHRRSICFGTSSSRYLEHAIVVVSQVVDDLVFFASQHIGTGVALAIAV